MTVQINWNGQKPTKKTLYFDDLELNQAFKNAGYLSRGAVYIKVAHKNGEEFMYEVQTGKIFNPTNAQVEIVPLELNVPVAKPALYD